jgi:hypothetical protein
MPATRLHASRLSIRGGGSYPPLQEHSDTRLLLLLLLLSAVAARQEGGDQPVQPGGGHTLTHPGLGTKPNNTQCNLQQQTHTDGLSLQPWQMV